MKTKTFDAVEMMHEGGRRVMAETAGMTVEQEVAYWAVHAEALLQRQQALRDARDRAQAASCDDAADARGEPQDATDRM